MKRDLEKSHPATAASRPLNLLCVQPYWLARKTLKYLLRDEPIHWSFADDDRQMLELIGKTPSGFDVVIVDHAQDRDSSGLRVLRALRDVAYPGAVLAISIEEITEIERARYRAYGVPLLVLAPENANALKPALLAAVMR